MPVEFPAVAGSSFTTGIGLLALSLALYALIIKKARKNRIVKIGRLNKETKKWCQMVNEYETKLSNLEDKEEKDRFREEFINKCEVEYLQKIKNMFPPSSHYPKGWMGITIAGLLALSIGALYSIFGIPPPGNEIMIGPFGLDPLLYLIDALAISAGGLFGFSLFYGVKFLYH